MIDAKGRVWLIDLNGASPLEVGPNAVTEEYMPAEVFRAAKSFFNSNKTTAWRYKNTALDVYLLGNTLIHMTACPQTYEKSSCKPDLQPAPTASESYDESWQDLISKLKAPNEDDRITVTAALTHDFLSEVDLAAAKTVVANIANHKTFIATWERTNRKKYRENVDVAKMKKRFADIFRRLKNKIEQYTEAATSKKVAQLVTLAEEVQGIIDDLDDKKERLIGGGLSPTDAALKLFEGRTFRSGL
jgi:serine/threonine protein kinase